MHIEEKLRDRSNLQPMQIHGGICKDYFSHPDLKICQFIHIQMSSFFLFQDDVSPAPALFELSLGGLWGHLSESRPRTEAGGIRTGDLRSLLHVHAEGSLQGKVESDRSVAGTKSHSTIGWNELFGRESRFGGQCGFSVYCFPAAALSIEDLG